MTHISALAPADRFGPNRLSENGLPTGSRNAYLVSAIVSTCNSEKFIAGCLQDLINQTIYKQGQLEIVVINSGSEQHEERIVRRFQTCFPHITYLKTERETIYAAWNRGVKIAKGKYLTNANTDDRHRRDALEILSGYLEAHPHVILAYARQHVTDQENQTFETVTPIGKIDWPPYNRNTLLEYCCVGPQPLWRKSLHEQFGYFDPSLEVAGDYEFWLRISEGGAFALIEDYLGLYYRSPRGANKEFQNRYVTFEETYTIKNKYFRKTVFQKNRGALFADLRKLLTAINQFVASMAAETLNPLYLLHLEYLHEKAAIICEALNDAQTSQALARQFSNLKQLLSNNADGRLGVSDSSEQSDRGLAARDQAASLRDYPVKSLLSGNFHNPSDSSASRFCQNQPAAELPWALCRPENFADFLYARKSHFAAFCGLDQALYGQAVDPRTCDLKMYQDLLVLAFIRAHVPVGARLLEVGGGNSRLLAHLSGRYECWNIDRFEGLGNGPHQPEAAGYRIVRDYMGAFNQELPEGWFDLVFSISALEHTPEKPETYRRILDDIHRVLKPDGWSLHLLDVVFKPEGFWTSSFVPYLFKHAHPVGAMPDPQAMRRDPDLYIMSEAAYNWGWKHITGKTWQDFGQPTSINVLWRKPAPAVQASDSEEFSPAFRAFEILTRSSLPAISIVTPSFNQAAFLEECLDSILSQGYPALEYLVLDGGSTDGSVDIIKKYARHLTFWRSAPDGGQYAAINEGLRRSTGDIMAWLNSDDKYHAGALYKVAYVFAEHRAAEWIVGRPTAWNEDGSLNLIFDELPLWTRQRHLMEWPKPYYIQQESVFWRRRLWEKAGSCVQPDLSYAGDFELWTRFFRHARLISVDALLGGYRFQAGQKVGLPSASSEVSGYQKYFQEARAIVVQELTSKTTPAAKTAETAPRPLLVEPDRYQTFLRKHGCNTDTVRIALGDSVTVITSLMPRNQANQPAAVRSWQTLGLHVVSMNNPEEIRELKPLYKGVQFVEAARTGQQLYGKPLVYFDDLTALARARRDVVTGIINSDIIIQTDIDLRRWLLREVRGALALGRSEDVTAATDPPAHLYADGFDCVFFDSGIVRHYPASNFCLGVPWWDYWAPLAPLLQGISLKSINQPSVRLLHVLHGRQWEETNWTTCGTMMYRLLPAILKSFASEQPGRKLREEFSAFYRDCFQPRLDPLLAAAEPDSTRLEKPLVMLGVYILDFIDKNTRISNHSGRSALSATATEDI